MRFAFKTAPQDTTWPAMLEVWKAADDIEIFESGWLFDHFYPIFSDSRGPCMEGWSLLAALASATRRLRLGLLVTGIHYRHPAVLAKTATTIDIVSGGRLDIGLGAGWNEEESGAYGIALGTLTERFDRFDEALACIVGLLSQDSTDFAGKYFTLTAAHNEPKPIQRPHPPIVIGGGGERRTLRSAARFAQHWNLAGGDPATFAAKKAVLAERCGEIGRDPSEIMCSVQARLDPSGDPSAIAALAAEYEAAGCDLLVVYLPPPHTAAVLEPLAEALAAV